MRVLISAYACEPGRGSEPAVGWAWARAAARDHEVWVLTRSNNRGPIEAALATRPEPNLHVVYVDLPPWARRWKRGRRGVRPYYLLWQIAAARVARRLHGAHEFDVIHHLTFANLWLPALVCVVPVPFVLGPVAGGQRVPAPLLRQLGAVGAATELLLRVARELSRLNPLVRLTWARAGAILVNNDETLAALPRRHRAKAHVRPNAVALDLRRRAHAPAGPPVAVVAGRLNRFKGVGLALQALALAPEWRLTIAGDGPDRARLQRLARELGVADRVELTGKLTQEELWDRTRAAHAVVLPSLKEGASLVCAETLALGIPVVAFDAGGPRALARLVGGGVRLVRPADGAAGIAAALGELDDDVPATALGPDTVARDLAAVYAQLARRPPARAVAAGAER